MKNYKFAAPDVLLFANHGGNLCFASSFFRLFFDNEADDKGDGVDLFVS